MSHVSEKLMIKYINNTCSDEELTLIKNWIEESDDNAKELFELEQTAMLATSLRDNTEQKLRVAEKINARIALDEAVRKSTHARKNRMWISVAASIAVVLAIAGIFLFRQPQVKMIHVVALNENRTVTLPDGSEVYLNNNSELQYPEVFSGESREVKLSGEGFFKVAHDENVPFIVDGRYLNVRVLGTEFNFRSHDSIDNSVSLLKGAVKVSVKDKNHDVHLTPGQKATYSISSGDLNVNETNASVDGAWHDRIIPFENANLVAIRDILTQLYNVTIELDKRLDLDKTYSGVTVYHDSIDSTLVQLSYTVPIEYIKTDGLILVIPKKE